MRIATITEAKNGLSALIDHVRAGGSVLILDRGVPVARLESAVGVAPDDDGRTARLQRSGVLRAPTAPPSTLALRPPPAPKGEASVVAALLEERDGGR